METTVKRVVFSYNINYVIISGERLDEEDLKKAADSNLATAPNNSTFTLKEKIAFFKKKRPKGHIANIVLCVAARMGIIIRIALNLRVTDEYPLLGALGGILAIFFMWHYATAR